MKKLVACIFAWALFATQVFAEAAFYDYENKLSNMKKRIYSYVFTNVRKEDRQAYEDELDAMKDRVEHKFRKIIDDLSVGAWEGEIRRLWQEELEDYSFPNSAHCPTLDFDAHILVNELFMGGMGLAGLGIGATIFVSTGIGLGLMITAFGLIYIAAMYSAYKTIYADKKCLSVE